MNYQQFLSELDRRLEAYFDLHKNYIHCKTGCSECCEEGDYPISQMELEYLMKGYTALDDNTKQKVQQNIKYMKKGGKCPFLIDKICSVYMFRPIICRVHGIAYLCKENIVKLPFCVNKDKNYSNVYKNGEVEIAPIKENLDTANILKNLEYGEIRNLFDWLNSRN